MIVIDSSLMISNMCFKYRQCLIISREEYARLFFFFYVTMILITTKVAQKSNASFSKNVKLNKFNGQKRNIDREYIIMRKTTKNWIIFMKNLQLLEP